MPSRINCMQSSADCRDLSLRLVSFVSFHRLSIVVVYCWPKRLLVYARVPLRCRQNYIEIDARISSAIYILDRRGRKYAEEFNSASSMAWWEGCGVDLHFLVCFLIWCTTDTFGRWWTGIRVCKSERTLKIGFRKINILRNENHP